METKKGHAQSERFTSGGKRDEWGEERMKEFGEEGTRTVKEKEGGRHGRLGGGGGGGKG